MYFDSLVYIKHDHAGRLMAIAMKLLATRPLKNHTNICCKWQIYDSSLTCFVQPEHPLSGTWSSPRKCFTFVILYTVSLLEFCWFEPGFIRFSHLITFLCSVMQQLLPLILRQGDFWWAGCYRVCSNQDFPFQEYWSPAIYVWNPCLHK